MTAPRIAFVGAGAIARYHASAAREAGFELAAIAASPRSRRARSVGEEFGFSSVFDTGEELLESSGWDALVICSIHELLFPYLKHALRDGRPILVEKPAAMRSSDIFSLLGTPNDHVAVAYNRRHYASSREARNFLYTNGRGVVTIEVPEIVGRTAETGAPEWKGVLTNSVHMFDLASYIAGGLGQRLHEPLGTPRVGDGSVQLRRSRDGHLVIIKAIWNSPANFSITLEAREQRYVLSPIEVGTRYSGMQVIEPTADVPIRRYVPSTQTTTVASAAFPSEKPGFVEQMLSFRSLVLGDHRPPELATLADAAAALTVAEDFIGV